MWNSQFVTDLKNYIGDSEEEVVDRNLYKPSVILSACGISSSSSSIMAIALYGPWPAPGSVAIHFDL